MNSRFIVGSIVALFFIASYPNAVHPAPATASPRPSVSAPPPVTDVTSKPKQQPVSNVAGAMTPCANYCNKERGVMIEQKLGAGGCTPTAVSSCFPYRCNYQGTLCNASCTGNSQCDVPNAYCDQAIGKCVAGNNCPSKCEGDNKSDYIPIAMMPNSNACKRDSTTSCYPYTCDPQKGACRYNCASDEQCAAGAMCNTVKGSCVPAVAHCDKKQPNILVLPDGTRTDCYPYLCKGNTCPKNCNSAADCFYDPDPQKSFVCDTQGSRACVPTMQN